MSLTELVREAEWRGEELLPELLKIVHGYDWSSKPQMQSWMVNDLYVRRLGGLCKVLGAKRVCEVGTMYGSSAIGLSLGATRVDSYDIDQHNFACLRVAKDRNINLLDLKDKDDFLNICYPSYDFIFFDVDDHDGIQERKFHDKLVELGYVGYVAYDDVLKMRTFWDGIKQTKLLVNWHGESGFGLVDYNSLHLTKEQKEDVENSLPSKKDAEAVLGVEIVEAVKGPHPISEVLNRVQNKN